MSFSYDKLIDPENYNYVELVIDQFKRQLSSHKFIKKLRKEIGKKQEELELKFLYSSLSRKKEVGMDVLISFLKSDEFKTYDFDILDLSNNSINLEKISSILKYLKVNPFITNLDLSANCLGSNNDKLKLYPSIQDYFSFNTTLKVLNLSFNGQCLDTKSYKFIILIINAIESNPNSAIEMIDLSYNNIEEKCIHAISKMLETNKSLKKLDLSFANLKIAYKILGKSLLENQTLEFLNISYCSLEIEDLISFGHIIENNFTLTEILYPMENIIFNQHHTHILDTICERNQKLVKSKEKLMNFILTIRKQEIKKRIFLVELYDLIFSEYILTF